MMITDAMCRRALAAIVPDRIQGFSTSLSGRTVWGAPHFVRDTHLPPDKQELWRGDDHAVMLERCKIEEMRLALQAALEGV